MAAVSAEEARAAARAKLDVFRVIRAPPTALYIRDFITQDEAQALVQQIYTAPKPKWRVLSNRRLQNWGGNPSPKGMVVEPLPPWLEAYAVRLGEMGLFAGAQTPRPNHVLINEYLPGQGIMPHEDGPSYHPTVATISLSSHTVLDFFPKAASGSAATILDANTLTEPETETPTEDDGGARPRRTPELSLVLQRGSLVVLQESMYKDYLHGIAERTHDTIDDGVANAGMCNVVPGETYERGTRISLTFRVVNRTIDARLLLGSVYK